MSPWPTVAIKRVARLGTGHTPSRQHPEYWDNCTIPWLTLADVWQLRDGTRSVVEETAEKISEVGVRNSSAVVHPAGTVALSRTASVGFTCLLGRDMATSQDFATWTCGHRIAPRFLLWVLRGSRDELRERMTGSTHKTIYMPDIESLGTPLPPMAEQVKIADFLDRETARIDALIAAKRRMIELLDEHDFSSLSDHVIPQDASFARLGYFASVQSGLTVDGSRTTSGDDVTRPYLRVANVQADRVELASVTEVTVPRALAERATLRLGDVLMTEGGDLDKLGRGAVWEGQLPGCLHQNHVFAVRPDPSRLDCRYLALLTRTAHGRSYFERTGVKTTNLASTNSSKILDLPVPSIDLHEQRRRVEASANSSHRTSSAASLLDTQLILLQEHRQALVTAAVTGEIAAGTMA